MVIQDETELCNFKEKAGVKAAKVHVWSSTENIFAWFTTAPQGISLRSYTSPTLMTPRDPVLSRSHTVVGSASGSQPELMLQSSLKNLFKEFWASLGHARDIQGEAVI